MGDAPSQDHATTRKHVGKATAGRKTVSRATAGGRAARKKKGAKVSAVLRVGPLITELALTAAPPLVNVSLSISGGFTRVGARVDNFKMPDFVQDDDAWHSSAPLPIAPGTVAISLTFDSAGPTFFQLDLTIGTAKLEFGDDLPAGHFTNTYFVTLA